MRRVFGPNIVRGVQVALPAWHQYPKFAGGVDGGGGGQLGPTQIEIAHIVYAIQPNSPASKVARSFFVGQVVDAVLSAPGVNSVSQVVSLAAHAGT